MVINLFTYIYIFKQIKLLALYYTLKMIQFVHEHQ